MAVTLKDVAERAGVSRSAVSRTFTEGASVSPKMRAKVMKVAKELGYTPNVLASSLTTRRTKLIGLISNNFRNPAYLQLFDLFTRRLQDRGQRSLLINLTDEPRPGKSIEMMQQYSVDGVVLASSSLQPQLAIDMMKTGIPVVHAFARTERAPRFDVVGIDNRASGMLAGRTMLERGYRRFGYLGGPSVATTTLDRRAGFMDVVGGRGDTRVDTRFAESWSHQDGYEAMKRLLAEGVAEAYFCADDILAIGAMAALREAGHRVPEDVGVLGMNDMELAAWPEFYLTTICQPLKEIIEASVDRIVALAAEPEQIPETRLFPCRLVERGTLRPLTD